MAQYAFLGLAYRPNIIRPETLERARVADEQAIDMILTAVGKKDVPLDLDREALCADIADAFCSRNQFNLSDVPEARSDVKALARIRNTAKKLRSLLIANDRVKAMIRNELKKPTPGPYSADALRQAGILPAVPFLPSQGDPIDLTVELTRWLLAIDEIERWRTYIIRQWRTAHKRDPALRGRRPTAKEWLAGVSLPLVFELHFLRKAKFSRRARDQKLTGSMLPFVSTVMAELGLPYKEESIARAFTRLKVLREKQRTRKVPAIRTPAKRAH